MSEKELEMATVSTTSSGPSRALVVFALLGALLFALGSISAVAGQNDDAFGYAEVEPQSDSPIPTDPTPPPTDTPAGPTGLPSAGSGGLAFQDGVTGEVSALAWALIAMGAFGMTMAGVRYAQRRS